MRIDARDVLHRVLVVGAIALATAPLRAHDRVPAAEPAAPIVIQGGTVHTIDGGSLERADVRIVAGRIEAVGSGLARAGDSVIDAVDRHVYPGFIAANSVLGLVEIGAVRATVDMAEVGANSANVRAEVAVNPDSDLIPVTRSNGVLLALTVPQPGGAGVISGTSALLQLDGWTWEAMTVAAPVALHVTWPTRFVPAGFPDAMAEAARKAAQEKRSALERAFDQARAYASRAADAADAPDLRLAAMQPFLRGERPVFFHADDATAIDEALEFAARRGLRAVLVGGSEAWRVTDRLKAQQVPVILAGTHVLPLRRHDAVDAIFASAAQLAAAGVRFALATPGDGFDTSNLRNLPYQAASAVAYGLPREAALRAITLTPAEILGVADRFGSIAVGKVATVFVADGDPLEATTRVERAWIEGREIDLGNRQTRLYEKYRQRLPTAAPGS